MTTPPLEDPGKELAAALRTAVLAAVKVGELLYRRRELMLRRELAGAQSSARDIERRVNTERRLAADRLRSARPTMRALAAVTPDSVATVYRDAVAWRDQLPEAKEVAESIETYMRGFGLDPDQLRAAGKEFARRVEPTMRPGLDLKLTSDDHARAAANAPELTDHVAAERDRIRPATLKVFGEHVGPRRRAEVLAELDRVDEAAARAVYERTQGLTGSQQLTPAMLADWRAAEAIRWATNAQAGDLALFAALVFDGEASTDTDDSDPAASQMTDLWLAWRAREIEGLSHPDFAQLSGLVFAAQLDRAHEFMADFDPDGYAEWQRMRSIDPQRADIALVRRYETEQATQWAGEIGDDLWKHGFARTAAQHPDEGLDDIARRVWTAAGKPEPAWDPESTTPSLEERWAAQTQAATRVIQQDPDLWRDWQAWRADPNHPPVEMAAQEADMVAEYHELMAETWAEDAREAGTLPASVSTKTRDQLMAAWRLHTAGQQGTDLPSDADRAVLDRAQAWLRSRDPLAYMAYQAHLDALPDTDRTTARAELVRDYETHEARRWAEASEVLGQVPEGTSTRDPDALIKMWRAYTAARDEQRAAQQPATSGGGDNTAAGNTTRSRGGQSKEGGRTGRSAQSQPPTLKELVGNRIPDWVYSKPAWNRGAERAFRGLVEAGHDPKYLADIVAKLRHHEARSPVALTIWAMREAVGQNGADPAGTGTNNSNENPADQGPGRGPTTAGMDPAAARAWKVANRAFGTAPTSPVQPSSGTTPGSTVPPMGSPHRSHDQSR
ncbi:hypothetical protein [Nocardia carnea]|uniref:hypothetical protein n=1 Tax=Nocardia carnea TaxID=37328 RepID=UPI0012F69404|nr:hypothetical protein [Nocardia carnea]